MRKKQDYLKIFPNLLTLGNMACGFLAIVIMSERGDYITAFWLILLGGVFDALDGAVARLTNAASGFGVELDSLADIVSFGAAPAYILYTFVLSTYGNLGILLSVLHVLAGGFRLARFNSSKTGLKSDHFVGLPIPLAALTVLTYIVSISTFDNADAIFSTWTIPLVISVALLMVSRLKFHAPPKFSLAGIKSKPYHFLFLIGAITFFIIFGVPVLFFIFVFVILIGIFQSVVSLFIRSEPASDNAGNETKEKTNNI